MRLLSCTEITVLLDAFCSVANAVQFVYLRKRIAFLCISCWPHSSEIQSLSTGPSKMNLTFTISLLLPCLQYFLLNWFGTPDLDIYHLANTKQLILT